jgi:two-component system, sensor histidine kinase and response regulator
MASPALKHDDFDDVPAAVPQALKPTLLVVDDEEGPRQSLRVVFKDEYNVLLASDGRAAIELARKSSVDVAVLDIRMGGMSGIELLGKLKEVDPCIEVVMMTAFETADTIRQALRLSACDYLNKPFDLNTMRDAVAKAMKRRSLSAEVRNNAEKLNALQAELHQQKMEGEMVRTRGEIYASIIHDINSPLTVISGLIQLINQRVSDDTEQIVGAELDEIKDRLKRITRQVTACIEISRRYLSILRKSESEENRVSVNAVLDDLGELLRAHPNVKQNKLTITRLTNDVEVATHRTDLIQILLNLTNNALKCTETPHQVEVEGQVLDESLRAEAFESGPNQRFVNAERFHNAAPLLALSIKDTGPGIPEEIMSKLFQPYFTTQAKSGGTGLGLCIVHRLVREAKGGVQVRSTPGKGTVFTVYLPAQPNDSTQSPSRAS